MKNPLLKIFISLLLTSAFASHADARKITGTVVESDTQLPIARAMVKGKSGSRIVSHAVADNKGVFSIAIADSILDKAMVEITVHGYEQASIPATTIVEHPVVRLVPSAEELNEVVVRPLAVKASGDTITYNVDAMRNIADRTIEDVIAHLPGVEVNNGQISYNGEPINTFYIEGMDALGGQYATASQNIRADDVMSVDVYERHEAKQVMRDISTTTSAAMNIKLKKRSMLRPSGHISGGLGKGSRNLAWLGKAFGMLISPTLQIYLTAGGNNFGMSPGKGGGLPYGARTPVDNLLQLYTVGGVNIPTQLYVNTRAANTSANAAIKTGKNSTLRLTAGYSFTRSASSGESLTRYPVADGGSEISISQSGRNIRRSQSVNLLASYELNAPSLYIRNDFQSGVRFNRGMASIKADPGGDVVQSLDRNDIVVSDNIDIISKSKKRIWEGKLNLNFHDLPMNRLKADDENTAELIVDQKTRATAFALDASTDLGWNVMNVSTIGLALGFHDDYVSINTEGYQGNEYQLIGLNNPKGNEAVLSVGPSYRLHFPAVRLEAGIPLQFVWQNFTSLSDREDYNKTNTHLAPYCRLNLFLPKELKGSFAVNYSKSRSGLANFLTSPIATSYRSVVTPGSGIPYSSSLWNATTNWSWRKITAGFFTSFSLGYMSSESEKMLSSVVTDTDISTEYVDMKSKNDNWNATLSMSKLMLGQKGTLKLDLSYSLMNSNMIRNSVLMGVKNTTISAALSFTAPLVDNHLVIKPSVVASRSSQKSGDVVSTSYFSWQGMFPMTALVFKGFDITVTPDFRSNPLVGSQRLNVFILNANARYTLKRWEFELHMNNLTDRRRYAVETYSNLIYSYTSAALKGMEALFTVKYNF